MRPLLYVNLAGLREPVAERLEACGWQAHAAQSIPEALRLIEQRKFSVGLVAAGSDAPIVELENLVLAHAATEWIALLPSPPSGQGRFVQLIAEAFFDYCSAPCDAERLARVLGHAQGRALLRREVARVPRVAFEAMVGESEPMRRLFRAIARAGANDEPVLMHGENGTGKELAAHAVHRQSRRRDKPFVVVDCSAPQAKQQLLAAPPGGTVFLNETGQLPRELQPDLLQLLQARAGVRVIAATRLDLAAAVAEGKFREDLYYRLRVVHFKVPPLRERPGDTELLARHFFSCFAAERSPGVKGFSRDALKALSVHRWPGNVRELINRVRSAVVMGESSLLGASDLGLAERGTRPPTALGTARSLAERDAVEASLRSAGNNVSRAARALGVSRVTLYRLMDKYAILPDRTAVSESLHGAHPPDRD